MGNLCSCCTGQPKETAEEKAKTVEAQKKAGLAAQQRTDGGFDKEKMTEAQTNAGLAAQRRAEAFEKSAVGRAAKRAAVEASKPAPVYNRGEPALRWQVG